MGRYLLYNATIVEENHRTKKKIYSEAWRFAFSHLVYISYSNHSSDEIFDIAALTVHFVVKSSFSRLSADVTFHNNGEY